MKARLQPLRGKPHRIGDRLVETGNAEPACAGPIRLTREGDGIVDAKAFRDRELSRNQDSG